MKNKTDLHIVSHTHWDREWYNSFEQMQLHWCSVMDEILNLLEDCPLYKHFMLDGQMAVVEDYLSIYPQKREVVKQLVTKKRLSIGPFYTLADENLICGEALTRNLLMGIDAAKSLGGHMPLGYLCDEFGHTMQMPQILVNAGITSAFVSRGVNREMDGSEFWWQSPDGSKVLAISYGYGGGMELPEEDVALTERVNKIINTYRPLSTSKHILLMNGGDSTSAQKRLPEIIKKIKNVCGVKAVHTSLAEFAERIFVEGCEIKTCSHELRYALQDLPVHVYDVLSSRYTLKRTNRFLESRLLRYAEPLCALTALNGGTDSAVFLKRAWKALIENQAHDSICGCSVDDVGRDMESRFRKTDDISRLLIKQGLDFIATNTVRRFDTDAYNLLVYNPLFVEGNGVITCTVSLHDAVQAQAAAKSDNAKYGNFSEIEYPAEFDLADAIYVQAPDGSKYAAEPVPDAEIDALNLHAFATMDEHIAHPVTLRFMANQLPPMGYTYYKIMKSELSLRGGASAHDDTLENEFYTITVHPNASIDVLVKAVNKVYYGLHLFFDNGDTGGGWDHVPPAHDTVLSTIPCNGQLHIISGGTLSATIMAELVFPLPQCCDILTGRRSDVFADCRLQCFISLESGSELIRFRTVLQNNAIEHRLRVAFDTHMDTNTVLCGAPFNEVARDIDDSLKNQYCMRSRIRSQEKPWPTKPVLDYLKLSDKNGQFVLLTGGHYEYEAESKDTRILLTLMRSNSHNERHWWPNIITNDAEYKGENIFTYAISFSSDSPSLIADYSMNPIIAKEVQCTTLPYTIKDIHNSMDFTISDAKKRITELPEVSSLVSLSNSKLVVSAFYVDTENSCTILRLYNPTCEPQGTAIRVGFPFTVITETDFLLNPIKNVDIQNLSILPKKIVTYTIK